MSQTSLERGCKPRQSDLLLFGQNQLGFAALTIALLCISSPSAHLCLQTSQSLCWSLRLKASLSSQHVQMFLALCSHFFFLELQAQRACDPSSQLSQVMFFINVLSQHNKGHQLSVLHSWFLYSLPPVARASAIDLSFLYVAALHSWYQFLYQSIAKRLLKENPKYNGL